MKKIIAVALAATMTLPCVAVNAESKIGGVYNALADTSEIHILYNDTVVEYEDVKPVNTDGRVMIPFRAALENMGAKVDYNDSNRLVTATKGETTISFTLMDDTIYIDNNGTKSTITMDVPMIIVEDRTLVPIRFMSNAFGMQVGWNGDTETVIIYDEDDFFDDFENVAPNVYKMITMEQPEFNSDYMELDLTLSGTLNANIVADSSNVDNILGSNIKSNIQLKDSELKDIKFDVVVKDNMMYFNTNLFEEIAKISDSTSLKSAALMINDNTWYQVDINKFIDATFQEDYMKVMLKKIFSQNNKSDSISLLKETFKTEGDADLTKMISLISMFDTFEQMDKYITITETENGGYSIKMNITTENYINIMEQIMGDYITDTDNELFNNSFKYDISANAEYNGTEMTSAAKLDVMMGGISIILDLSQTSKNSDSIKAAEIPENASDITDLIVQALK